jgi:hypothetical protein
MNGKPWTQADEELMRQRAGECESYASLALLFPGRSECSVRTRAERLRVNLKGQRREWTEAELTLVKQYAPEVKELRTILHLFPGRSLTALKHAVDRLGLERKVKYHDWSPSMVKTLIDLYPHISNAELAEKLGKTEIAITNKARDFNLAKSAELISRENADRFRGKTHTETTKNLMVNAWAERQMNLLYVHPWVGRHHSLDSKKQISEGTQEWFKNNDHPMLGKQHTEESKEHMRKPHQLTEEQRDKLRRLVMERDPFSKKYIYTRPNGANVPFHSSYEVKLAAALDKHGFIWQRNTAEGFEWFDDEDKRHVYYPDFMVVMEQDEASGRIKKAFVETKGEHLTERFEFGGNRAYTITKAEAALAVMGPSGYVVMNLGDIEIFEDTGVLPLGDDPTPTQPEVALI